MENNKKKYLQPEIEIDYYDDYVLERVECTDSPFGGDVDFGGDTQNPFGNSPMN